MNALADGQAWLCGPEKLRQLEELVSPMRQSEVARKLAVWERGEFGLNLNWWPEGELSYTLGDFSGKGIDKLKEKMAQFPAGTRLTLWLATGEREDHRSEIKEVERVAAAGGLVLTVKEPCCC